MSSSDPSSASKNEKDLEYTGVDEPQDTTQSSTVIHLEPLVTIRDCQVRVVLERRKHLASALANAVIAQLQGPNLTAFLEHKRWVLEEWNRTTAALAKKLKDKGMLPDDKDMYDLLSLIRAMFFFNANLWARFHWVQGKYTSENNFGSTDAACEGGKHWSIVEIDPEDLHKEDGVKDHFTSIISTLLHESIHAFLIGYSCALTCNDAACDKVFSMVYGDYGHGSAFVQILTHVEAFADKYLCEGVNLGFKVAIEGEYAASHSYLDGAEIELCHPRYHETLAGFAQYWGGLKKLKKSKIDWRAPWCVLREENALGQE